MIILFALQIARVLAGDPSQGINHIEQVAVVAQFLAIPEKAIIAVIFGRKEKHENPESHF